MKLGIIGLGPVGMSLLGCAISKKHEVKVIDINPKAYDKAKGHATEKEWLTYVRYRNRFTIHSSYEEVNFGELDALMVCVDTRNVMEVAMFLKGTISEFYKLSPLITLESSVDAMNALWFVRELKDCDTHVVVSPERIMEGKLLHNFRELPKYVGADGLEAWRLAENLYKKLGHKSKLFRCTIEEACVAKLTENGYRFWNIRFANMISDICAKTGNCDFEVVRELVNSLSSRDMHESSIGIGGTCLEQNATMLWMAYREEAESLRAAIIEEHARQTKIRSFILETIPKVTGLPINDVSVLFLGAAYRPDGFGIRNSPALNIYDEIRHLFKSATIYDSNVYSEERKDIHHYDLLDWIRAYDVVVWLVPHASLKQEFTQAMIGLAKRNERYPAIINLTSYNPSLPSEVIYIKRRF